MGKDKPHYSLMWLLTSYYNLIILEEKNE